MGLDGSCKKYIHLVNPFEGAFPVTFITIGQEIMEDKILSAGGCSVAYMKTGGDLNFVISKHFWEVSAI